MDRVVFCPNESLIDGALELAKEWGLTILVGDSERTRTLTFDRDSVGVVLIPVVNEFKNFRGTVDAMTPFSIYYQNDFINSDTVRIYVCSISVDKRLELKVTPTDIHGVHGACTIAKSGRYSVVAQNGEEELLRREFETL